MHRQCMLLCLDILDLMFCAKILCFRVTGNIINTLIATGEHDYIIAKNAYYI